MGFPFLTIFLVIILWLAFKRKQVTSKQEATDEQFWEAEKKARITPPVDITNLDYINIPIDKFPLNFSQDPDILDIERELVELSNKKILNLTGKTNTELRLTYGVTNFDTMSEIGENFDKLTILLDKYAKALMENGSVRDVISVLEFAVGIGTDMSSSYTLLAECYSKEENATKLGYLKEQIESSNLTMKKSILEKLATLK